jgi:hypothetical protein
MGMQSKISGQCTVQGCGASRRARFCDRSPIAVYCTGRTLAAVRDDDESSALACFGSQDGDSHTRWAEN